jgi:tetratricopeptide (TPR) repeat protein
VRAVADYSQAIVNQPSPRAGDYLERAQLQATISGPAVALKGLDEGLARLGWTLTLQMLAVDCEVACGNYDAALTRLETILTRSARRESWLARKGEILHKAARLAESRSTFEAALAAINSLPPRLVAAEKTTALRAGIETELTALDREQKAKPGSPAN